MASGKRALPSPDAILLHATVKLEAAPTCSSAERSPTAVLEDARLFVRGDPSALDASAVFVELCALLTDHDVAIRRDACRLLASVPLSRVPAQRLSQAVSKRPIKETVPGAPSQRASKVGRTAPLESRADGQWDARGADGVLSAEDGGASDAPGEREGRVVEEASQGGLVVALEDQDVDVRRAALAALAAFGRQGVDAAGRGVASEGAAGNAARQLLRTVTSLLVDMSTDEDEGVRVEALRRLAALGAAAPLRTAQLLPLRSALNEPSAAVQQAALDALCRCGLAEPAEALPELRAMLGGAPQTALNPAPTPAPTPDPNSNPNP